MSRSKKNHGQANTLALASNQDTGELHNACFDPMYEFNAPRYRDFDLPDADDQDIDKWFGMSKD